MWAVASAPFAGAGRVNVSPRGHEALSVLGPHRLGWVDLTGSGVETIAHLRENGRITLLFCSFAARPRIVGCTVTAPSSCRAGRPTTRWLRATPRTPVLARSFL